MWSDCCKDCHVGPVNEVLHFVAASGACSEESYPCTASDDGHSAAFQKASSIAGFDRVAANDEVAHQPVSILVINAIGNKEERK
jgi:hypothetical protein